MPRVTAVLDYSIPPVLANWYKNNSKSKCEAIAAETARIGGLVDTLIQQDIKEGGYVPPEEDQQALNCLAHWEEVKKDHPLFVPSVKEMQVELVDGNLTGHPDYICIEENGDWGITDLKCTSGIRFKNYVQCAIYSHMLMRIRGYEFPSFIRIVRLPREEDQKYEWSEIRDAEIIKYLMGLFFNYLAIYNSEKFLKEFFRTQLEDKLLGEF